MDTQSEQLTPQDGRCANALVKASQSQESALVIAEQNQADEISLNAFTRAVCETYRSCSLRESQNVRSISFLNPITLQRLLSPGQKQLAAKGPRVIVSNKVEFFQPDRESKSNVAVLEKRKTAMRKTRSAPR